ncbi:hypothetical protein ONE63_000018 [Megalurothrips usitatus]|uniref:Uncharacterized protein n=1 Tax=Megalurothrips usitatus TaxID=439358 RepID=A0AAV7XZN9_9NEOP|nr:hypothetical protein ONE63_000018 [Megalurothrips usitatus]
MNVTPWLIPLLTVVSAVAGQQCEDWEWQCDSGQCTDIYAICRHWSMCDDLSDNNRNCKVASVSVAVGDVITARIPEFRARYNGVVAAICDPEADSDTGVSVHCNAVTVTGYTPRGEMSGVTEIGCDAFGDSCYEEEETFFGPRTGVERLQDGELVLRLERSEDALAVWLPEHPKHAVTVPADGGTLLRLIPHYRHADMAVEFAVHTSEDA